MTTNNNNLTIEQMREIVDGAPEEATDYRKLSCSTRYVRVGERYAEWWNGEKWCRFSEPFTDENNILRCKPLNDLRTAIAKHDEFKVGDLVLTIDPWFGKTLLKITGFAMVAEKTALFEFGGFFRVSALRHGTPAEIKAGHRIDDTTDHVTDIRNHVSPITRVVDL